MQIKEYFPGFILLLSGVIFSRITHFLYLKWNWQGIWNRNNELGYTREVDIVCTHTEVMF